MSLGERIRKARDAKGLKQSELAEMIEVKSAGVISNWEKDINKPDADKIIKLCEVLGISASYLLDYYGNTINVSIEEQEHITKYRSLDPYGKKTVTAVLDIEYERCLEVKQLKAQRTRLIDFINIPVSAGIGTYLDNEQREKKTIVDSALADKADFILRIDGDSMEPKFYTDDYVFVKKQDAVDLGQICIYYVDGKGYMKKYGGDRLISLNHKYDDILFEKYDIDEISCFGLVLGLAQVVE